MSSISAKATTGDVILVASTVDVVTLDRGPGEDPLTIDVYPYVENVLGEPKPPYKGFRIVNNDETAIIYYTIAYNDNVCDAPVVGAEETYRLNAGATDQWICDPATPSTITVKLISEATPTYNVEAW